jgi:nucleotide-binding universal stress UspA family protein
MSALGTTSPFTVKKILVSTDGSENAKRAVNAATDVAKRFSADLLILYVLNMAVTRIYSPIAPFPSDAEYSRFFETSQAAGQKMVNEALNLAKQNSVNATGKILDTMGSVPEAILEAAEKEKVDMIVVGTRGLGGFKKLLLGSVSSAIVAHAHCRSSRSLRKVKRRV